MNPKSEPFSLGSSIVVPEKGVRYVCCGRGIYKLFHDDLTFCGGRDTKGFCNGHDIEREKFIEKYCNGIAPKQMEIDSAVFNKLERLRCYMSGEKCLEKFKRYKELRAAGLNRRNAFERLGINPHSASSFVQRGKRLIKKEGSRKEVKKK